MDDKQVKTLPLSYNTVRTIDEMSHGFKKLILESSKRNILCTKVQIYVSDALMQYRINITRF